MVCIANQSTANKWVYVSVDQSYTVLEDNYGQNLMPQTELQNLDLVQNDTW